jgi:ABC-2 type transport system ATP-binding protein
VTALRGIDLSISAGEVHAVLGPNGSGKTTLVKVLSTLLLPTAGIATVAGFDVATEPMPVRRRIGVVFGGDRGLYDRLSAVDNLRFAAALHGLDRRHASRRIPEVLHRVDLVGAAERRVETYSRGMRQRLHIARALLHDPDVLFLDEPSNGLDPIAARELRRLVIECKAAGKSVLLTTHQMAEADELADRISVIADGAVRASGTPAAIKAGIRVGPTYQFDTSSDVEGRLQELVASGDLIDVRSEFSGWTTRWTLRAPIGGAELAEIGGALRLPVDTIVRVPPTLEDAYVAIVSGA